MPKFKSFTPYHLNYAVFGKIPLKPHKTEGCVNHSDMLLSDLFNKIAQNNYEFTYASDYGVTKITAGGNLYSFDFIKHSEIFELILDLGKDKKDFNAISFCEFLYIEHDSVKGDLHDFYDFFIAFGNEIYKDRFALSDSPGERIPDDLLVERNDEFSYNQSEDTAARARILYDTWMRNTFIGQVAATKIKIRQEQSLGLAPSSLMHTTLDTNIILRHLTGISKTLNIIAVLLLVIAAIAIYFVFLK